MGDNDLNGFPPAIDKFELLQVVSYDYNTHSHQSRDTLVACIEG